MSEEMKEGRDVTPTPAPFISVAPGSSNGLRNEYLGLDVGGRVGVKRAGGGMSSLGLRVRAMGPESEASAMLAFSRVLEQSTNQLLRTRLCAWRPGLIQGKVAERTGS